ncbi:RNA-binding protein, CCR4-NOT complex subunit Rcd1 [Tieghemiomyces parasiticus]|uniref:RNA-binding protein, CCR4-NOT complex subunit Rcd1 n=1 Tax=Tieghemiomyces parasiticus TaxID=78921 RepID=A0A9W8E0P4_9FUNG|nr:RNA-binding protein, CCR4-NOT complex subunit Rcd1 [Tieghemiomyces parasiticus]
MQPPTSNQNPLSSAGHYSGLGTMGSASGIGRGAPTYSHGGSNSVGGANPASSGPGSLGALFSNGPSAASLSGGSGGGGVTQLEASNLHYLLTSPAPGGGNNNNNNNHLHGAGGLGGGAGLSSFGRGSSNPEGEIYALVMELYNPTSREQALSELSKRRDQFEDLALVLWNGYGVMAIILQEIITVYPLLHSSTLSVQASNRVCNALALLQLVAAHPETRHALIRANFPQFLYPFLSTTSKSKPYDNLRLTSLGVIGAIVKNDNPEVIHFFLQTEFLPLCLKIMEIGTELCKVVATFIFHKILSDQGGLLFMTDHPHRFYIVQLVLNNMIEQLVESSSPRLLKIIVRCYLRLADDPRAHEELRQHLPEPLRNATFSATDDPTIKRYFAQLLIKLSDNVNPSA